MTERTPEFSRIIETGEVQDRIIEALLPVILGIDSEDKREAAQVVLEATAAKLSTAEGLVEYQAIGHSPEESNK
jgi:hypothetical protein